MKISTKITTLGVLTAAILSFPMAAHATDPCSATLCLSPLVPSAPVQCTPAVMSYFAIKRYNKHGFDHGWTAQARKTYLDTCVTADAAYKAAINLKYGRLEHSPITFY